MIEGFFSRTLSSIFVCLLTVLISVPTAWAKEAISPQEILKEILAPRIYGQPNAPLKVILVLSPSRTESNQFVLQGLPILLQKVESGRIQLEVRTYSYDLVNIPVGLTARCLDPSTYLSFLSYVAQNLKTLQEYKLGFTKALTEAVRSNKVFWPQGLNETQLIQRLATCHSLQSAFIIAQEKERFETDYLYKLDFPPIAPVLIVNDGQRKARFFKSFAEISKHL